MGMKKGGKSSGFGSQGQRPNVSKKLTKAMRKEYTGSIHETLNKQAAWKKNKNVVLTIANPNTNETNKRFIKVNSHDVWGNPKAKPSVNR